MTETALLIVDVQQALFDRPTPVYHADELLANINSLVERAHGAGAPVVYIQHGNDSQLRKGTPGWELHPAMRPQSGDLMAEKTRGDAFEGTPLTQDLRSRGVTTVVVTGLVTHGCVKNTSLGAKKAGFRVVLVKDGHSSYSGDAAGLIETWNGKLAEAGVEVEPTKEIAFG